MDMATLKVQVFDTMQREGRFIPSIILETTDSAGIVPVHEMPKSPQERLLLFYRVGHELATVNKGVILDVSFISEVVLARHVGKSVIRREILAIDRAMPAPGHASHEILCYDIIRQKQRAELREISGYKSNLYGPLLDMFIAGFNGDPF